MTLQPEDVFVRIPYEMIHDRATLLVRSTCGPIQVSVSINHNDEIKRHYFRPDSPVYNVTNASVAGNVVISLRDATNTRDVTAVTFYNNSSEQGRCSVSVALNDHQDQDPNDPNFPDPNPEHKGFRQLKEVIEFTLQEEQAASVHIVFYRV